MRTRTVNIDEAKNQLQDLLALTPEGNEASGREPRTEKRRAGCRRGHEYQIKF